MRTLALFALLALLGACGDNLPPPVPIDDYEAAVREAECSFLARCGEVESVATCLALSLGPGLTITANQRAGVIAGAIRYDGAAARRCVDAIALGDCDVSSESERILAILCQPPLAGSLRDGETCRLSEECRSQVCSVPSCDMACCSGRCIGDTPPAIPGPGQPCPDSVCAAGLACHLGGCERLLPAGASCEQRDGCDYGLLCLDGRCQTPPVLGETCSGICRDRGTRCDPDTQTCVPVGLAGAACSITADPSGCSVIYACDRTGHCSAGIALGQPCGLGDRCAGARAFCDTALDGSPGVCALPRADGAPCTRDAGCTSLHCDPFTLRCTTPAVCL